MATLTVTAGDAADLRTKVETTAVEGDVVEWPRGDYAIASPITINKGIRLLAEGHKTRLLVSSAIHGIVIDNSAASINRLKLENFSIVGSGGATLDGVSFVGTVNKKLVNTKLLDLTVSGMDSGINLIPFDIGASAGVHVEVEGCEVTTNRKWGINVQNVSMMRIRGCEANASGKNGIRALVCGRLLMEDCSSEGNNTTLDTSREGGAQVLIKLSHNFTVEGLDVEALGTDASAAKVALSLSNCFGGYCGGLDFAQSDWRGGSIGLYFLNGSRAIELGPYIYSYLEYPWLFTGDSPLLAFDPRTIRRMAPASLPQA